MIGVKVKGIDTLIKKTNVRLLLTGIKHGMNKALKITHGEAIKQTNIDTGVLRKGYREKYSSLRGKLFNKVKYARYVNDRYNFLKKTTENIENKVNKIFNSEIEKQLGLLR